MRDGTPIVLLHGFTGTHRIWDGVLERLAGLDVRALPLPGHRGGAACPPDVGVEALADALERELAGAHPGPVHVVGNSLGGWLGLELAARGRAASVLALAPAGFWTDAEFPRLAAAFHRSDRAARLSLPLLPALARLPIARRIALREVARRGDRLRPEQIVEVVRGVVGCSAYPALLEASRPGVRRYELDVPVRAVFYDHDRYFPPGDYLPRFAERVPGSETAVVKGPGHIPMVDAPDLVAAEIRAWVSR